MNDVKPRQMFHSMKIGKIDLRMVYIQCSIGVVELNRILPIMVLE